VRKAYILVNLGAPEDFSKGAAERFLREFLSDKHVISLPYPFRKLLAFYISKARGARYAESLKQIALNGKHPLLHYTQSLARKVAAKSGVPTFAAFRYGNDSVESAVDKARSCGANKFRFIPMYPQSALSTSVSAKRRITRAMRRGDDCKILPHYFDNPLYISALSNSLRNAAADADCAVASFHSVPLSHLEDSPYREQCEKTAELIGRKSGMKEVKVAWQSRMGRGSWLGPSAEEVGKSFAQSKGGRIAVICPGFSCDCTETLLEIGRDLRASCMACGAKDFKCVPCLNDSDAHAEMFCELFERMK